MPSTSPTHWLDVCRLLAWLAAAGALGTLARFGLAGLMQKIAGERFPWGTFTVNVLGCLLFGLVWTLAEDRLVISGRTRFIVLTGFMGAFTTFSTYAYETSDLLRDSQWWPAAANIVGQNALGLACVFLGLALGKWL